MFGHIINTDLLRIRNQSVLIICPNIVIHIYEHFI